MSYQSVKLGDVCEVLSGYAWTAAKFNTDKIGIPVIRIQNVASVMDCDFVYWDEAYDERFVIRTGDIVLTLSGSFRVESWKGPDALLNQRIVKLTPSSKLDERWFLNVLQTRLSEIENLGRHALVNNVSIRDIRNLDIPASPLPEQRRIAAILDQADALRAKRREALAQLDSLTQSIFIEMFGDPAANSKVWAEGTLLGDVADIVSGVTKGRKLDGKKTREVPYLAVANVQEMQLNLNTVKRIDATEEEIERYALRDGDLLLTEGGDPDKLGRGTLWNSELPECIHQNHVFRVRVTADTVTPYFLNWLVGSQRGKRYFLKSAKQTTGIASINMTQLRGFPLLLPPLSLQREFEEVIGTLKQHSTQLQAAADSCNALFASLQHRAFRGEL